MQHSFVYTPTFRSSRFPCHFACRAQAGGCDGGGVDPDVGVGLQDSLERLAEAGSAGAGVRDHVVLALVLERLLAGEDLAEDGDVFLRARQLYNRPGTSGRQL